MLNEAQQRAVTEPGHVLITACPGSGKTTVLRYRARHILEASPAHRVAAVTFTVESATELASRIKATSPDAANRVAAGTFHRLCLHQLRQAGRRITLLSEPQARLLIRRARDEIASDVTLELAEQFIGAAKAKAEPGLASAPPVLAEIFTRYEELRRARGAMDFSDLILEALHGMRAGRIQPLRATHLLVDEFQDCDDAQLQWTLHHAEAGVAVTVVGDDDQCIFGFRSALGFEAMQRFRAATSATHISLDVTYRCAQDILKHAGAVIANNEARVPKALRTVNPSQGSVKLYRTVDSAHEAGIIAHAVKSESRPMHEIAILARSNARLDGIEGGLLANQVPYVRIGGRSLFESRSGAVLIGLLQAIAGQSAQGLDHALAAARVATDTIDAVHEAASRLGGAIRGLQAMPPGGPPALEDLRVRAPIWADQIRAGRTNLAVYAIEAWIEAHAFKGKPCPVLPHCVRALTSMSGTLSQRLRLVEQRNRDLRPDAVRLMTLHASKGLEFDVIWIAGTDEGVLPHEQAQQAEERRLFYVGMTRARHHLNIACSAESPSSFLAEAELA